MSFLTGRIIPIGLYTFDASSLTGGYDILCSGLSKQAFFLRFTNNSDADVFISFDGSTNKEILMDGSIIEIGGPHMRESYFSKSQKIWIKGVAGTGDIYVAAYSIRKG